jgi:hypothetical protein
MPLRLEKLPEHARTRQGFRRPAEQKLLHHSPGDTNLALKGRPPHGPDPMPETG